jgi:hypothetical protein
VPREHNGGIRRCVAGTARQSITAEQAHPALGEVEFGVRGRI